MGRQISDREEDLILEMHGMLNQFIGEFKGHKENKTIHQVPPCDSHKGLASKLWAIGMLAFAGAVGAAYNALKG